MRSTVRAYGLNNRAPAPEESSTHARQAGTSAHSLAHDASIVVPAYRATETIGRTIRSCLDQVQASNVFVVLDGPDDALEAAALAASSDINIVKLDQNRGAPTCRNIGLDRVNTPYVMFLDSDDYIEGPMVLSACALATSADADVVFAPFAFEHGNGNRQHVEPGALYGDADNIGILRRWLSGRYVPPCSVVWRTDFVRKIGGWDQSLAKNQDGDLMFRGLLSDARVVSSGIGAGIYTQDDNPNRITRSISRRTLQSQLAVLEKVRVLGQTMTPWPKDELATAYYGLARQAYGSGADDLGKTAEGIARSLGLNGQPGPPAHRILANLFGLRNKQRLTRALKQLMPARPSMITTH